MVGGLEDGLRSRWLVDGAPTGAPAATMQLYSSGTISNATMLMILISGFTAGPAVSL